MRATGAQFRFNFVHTNQAQVERALLNVNVRKSYCHDMLPPRLVKESAAVISKPIIIYDRLLATQLAEFYSTILLDFISSYTKFRLGQILKKAAFKNSVGKLEGKLVNTLF